MADSDLEAIRRARLQQLQAQGGGGSGEYGRMLRWRRWCLLLFVIFFFSAGGALVAIWEDASAIGVKVCVSQDRAPTHVAGGCYGIWYIHFIA